MMTFQTVIKTAQIVEMFDIGMRSVRRWVEKGLLTPLNPGRNGAKSFLFALKEVERLVPEKLRGRRLALIAPRAAVSILGVTANTLRCWALRDEITYVMLPYDVDGHPHRRYVRWEIELIATMMPYHSDDGSTLYLSNVGATTGIPFARLRGWVESQRLPVLATDEAGDVLVRLGAVRKCLIDDLYL